MHSASECFTHPCIVNYALLNYANMEFDELVTIINILTDVAAFWLIWKKKHLTRNFVFPNFSDLSIGLPQLVHFSQLVIFKYFYSHESNNLNF